MASARACTEARRRNLDAMLDSELSRAALELPVEDRLELARRFIESVVEPTRLNVAVDEGIRRIRDVAVGRVSSLTEEQYRATIG